MSDPYFGLLSKISYMSECLRTGFNEHIVEIIILVVEYRHLLQLGSHSTWKVHVIERYSFWRREIH
jgi:hypothetical protein